MRKLIVVVVVALIAVVSALAAPRAEAQTNYPQVSTLVPFSPDANFMSLPGYLRFLVLQQSGTWISHDQAVQVVAQQQGK